MFTTCFVDAVEEHTKDAAFGHRIYTYELEYIGEHKMSELFFGPSPDFAKNCKGILITKIMVIIVIMILMVIRMIVMIIIAMIDPKNNTYQHTHKKSTITHVCHRGWSRGRPPVSVLVDARQQNDDEERGSLRQENHARSVGQFRFYWVSVKGEGSEKGKKGRAEGERGKKGMAEGEGGKKGRANGEGREEGEGGGKGRWDKEVETER